MRLCAIGFEAQQDKRGVKGKLTTALDTQFFKPINGVPTGKPNID